MDIWKHGKYFDTWSVVHFLSGFILVAVFDWLGFGFIWTMLYSVAVLLAWEAFEALVKIIEPSANVIVDIVVGLAGAAVAACLYFYFDFPLAPAHLWILSGVTIILAVWGFWDYLKKGYR